LEKTFFTKKNKRGGVGLKLVIGGGGSSLGFSSPTLGGGGEEREREKNTE